MRRGPKPAKDKGESKPPSARKSPKNDGSRDRDLEKRLEEALRGRAEALQREAEGLKRAAEAQEQQAATAKILRVISSSPTDAQPVFDTIIQSAVRLLDGFSGVITQIVGDQLHLAALTSTNPAGDAAQRALWPKSVKEDASLHGLVIAALAPRFITDVELDPSVPPVEVAVA